MMSHLVWASKPRRSSTWYLSDVIDDDGGVQWLRRSPSSSSDTSSSLFLDDSEFQSYPPTPPSTFLARHAVPDESSASTSSAVVCAPSQNRPLLVGASLRSGDRDVEVTPEVRAKHANKSCRPCILHKRGMCKMKADCTFCHLDHPRNHKTRLCKAARVRQKLMLQRVVDSETGPNSSPQFSGARLQNS